MRGTVMRLVVAAREVPVPVRHRLVNPRDDLVEVVLRRADRVVFFFSSRRRHTRWNCDWSSDVCSSDLFVYDALGAIALPGITLFVALLFTPLVPVMGNVHSRARWALPVLALLFFAIHARSEERRVGKEGRSRWSADH